MLTVEHDSASLVGNPGACLTYVQSGAYRAAAKADLLLVARDPKDEDAFFNSHKFVYQFFNPVTATIGVALLHAVLNQLIQLDEPRYRSMHKGSPFYFLAMCSYWKSDFDGALLYLDAAVAEDYRAIGKTWIYNPAGRFLSFDLSSLDQAGYLQNVHAGGQVQVMLDHAKKAGVNLTLADIQAKLTQPAVEVRPELRSVITAVITFALEHHHRALELGILGSSGTGEPFFLYLFKGSLVLESLLRNSAAGQLVAVDLHKPPTMGKFLEHKRIYQPLLGKRPDAPGTTTFDEVVKLAKSPLGNETLDERSLRVAWGVRNTTGHNLAWPARPTFSDFEALTVHLSTAICAAIEGLY